MLNNLINSDLLQFMILFILFLFLGFLSKTFIKKYLQQKEWYWSILYVFGITIGGLYLVNELSSGRGNEFVIYAFLLFIFSRFILIFCHSVWLLSKTTLRETLFPDYSKTKIYKYLWLGWKNNAYCFCNDKYIVDIEPFSVQIFCWDKITEITGCEVDANTTDSTILEFFLNQETSLVVSSFSKNFNDINKMIQRKFPMISKDWQSHVFNTEGRMVMIYSYKTQVY